MKVRDPIQISRLMVRKGVSARELSKAAGWKSHTYMLRILDGKIKSVQPEPARLIAEHLGVDRDRIFLTEVIGESGQSAKRRRAA
jgi:lambda repressor-like predicted transcriptional regulator